MYDIIRLTKELDEPDTSIDEAGVFDQMQRLNDLANQDKFAEAAELSSSLLESKYYHIVPLSIVVFESYRESGPKLLPVVVQAVTACLGVNSGKIIAEGKPLVQIERRLSWLFDTMTRYSKYYSTQDDATYTRWRSVLVPGDFGRFVELLGELRTTLAEGLTALNAEVGAYLEWLRQQPRVVVEELPAESAADPAEHGAGEAATELPAGLAAERERAPGAATMSLPVSPALALLLSKLAAFEELVKKGRFDKAAIVSVDLRKELESFDPRRYFPGLFATYTELMSRHVEQIAPYFERTESLSFQLLHDFYTVNLRGFVAGDG